MKLSKAMAEEAEALLRHQDELDRGRVRLREISREGIFEALLAVFALAILGFYQWRTKRQVMELIAEMEDRAS